MSKVASTDLRVLMEEIGKVYAFTPQKYPVLSNVGSNFEETMFAVNHSLKHMTKSSGSIAAQCEAQDHGGRVDLGAIATAAIKQVINSLNLANVLGITPEQLVRTIHKELK